MFTYRIAKGEPLTHEEFDANMEHMVTLEEEASESVSLAADQVTLAEAQVALAEDAKDSAEAAQSSVLSVANATVYSGTVTYPAGAVVQDPSDSYLSYISQQDDNLGNTPSADDGTWWAPVQKVIPNVVHSLLIQQGVV